MNVHVHVHVVLLVSSVYIIYDRPVLVSGLFYAVTTFARLGIVINNCVDILYVCKLKKCHSTSKYTPSWLCHVLRIHIKKRTVQLKRSTELLFYTSLT